MATAEPPKPVTGVLYKRQRGLKSNSKDSKGLKWQRRTIRLMPNAIEYYGVKATTPNGSFPVQRIKIVTKIPEDTFRKKYCFQVGDKTEVIYFKAKTDEKRTNWMQTFRKIAIENGNVLSEHYHTGAYGLLTNPARWSCCDNEMRESKGCEKIVTCTLPCESASVIPDNNDTMIFSEEELSDIEEMESTYEQSYLSAPGLFMAEQHAGNWQLDTCPLNEELHPHPVQLLSHLMVTRSNSDSMKPIIHEDASQPLLTRYQSSQSIDSGFGDVGKHGSQASISTITNVSRSVSQRVNYKPTSTTEYIINEEVTLSKACQTDEDFSSVVSMVNRGDIKSLRTVIDDGMDPNMDMWVGCHKMTLLSLACEHGQEQLVNMIITEHKPSINSQDESGQSPLMIAAKKGLKRIVHMLIERGADISLQSFNGRTALHEAAEGGHLEIVHTLLEHKADPLVCSGEHRPYDLAISKDHRQIAEALQEKMPKKLIPYTPTKLSIHLHSKVGSLQFIGFGKIVASTDSEVSLIDTNLQTVEVEKVASDSVASLDLWKDTLILGSKCLQFINVKKFEWRLSYEESKDITQNVNYKQEQCQAFREQNLVAVNQHGKMVSSHLNGATLRIWEPAIMKDNPFQLESTRITGFTPHQVIEVSQISNTELEVYSLSISMDQNAPYIAVGVIRHSECEVLIYNYKKKADQLPYPVIRLGKSDQKSIVALSPDGRILASGMDQKLEMFSATTGETLHTFSNFGNDAYISSLCFPPAGTHEHLLIGLSTGDIKVFSQDLNDGPLFTLREPKSENSSVTALAYSKDTHFLASGHHNGLVHIWKAPIGKKSSKSLPIETRKFVAGSEGGKYVSEKDGYGFVIPSGVLDKDLTITHGIIPFGKVACQFPEQIIPVSNIALICPDQECNPIFSMEVLFQHCVNLDLTNPDKLKGVVLLKANHCDSSKMMDGNYQLNFEPVEDAKIYPSQNPHELTAQVRHCCAFCYGTDISQKDTDLAIRFNLVEIKPKTIRESCWRVDYCLSYVFQTCMEELKHRHPEEYYIITPHTIEFSPVQDGTEPYIELNITEPEKLGWKINILGSKQITKRSVYFWDYDPKELVQLQLLKKFPPRVTLEIDASKAKKDASVQLSFQGAIAYPGKENLCLNLQLSVQNTTETTIPTLNGFISKTAVSGHESNTLDTTHLEVLRRHHAELVRMIGSLAEFNTLLVEAFAKEIIDPTTYEKFLMKQESNPHCSSTVLSGLLLLDIAKHLQEKPHLFLSFCKCIEKVNADCAKELKDDYEEHKPQLPSEEAQSQVSDDGHAHAYGEDSLTFAREEDTGLQSAVKTFPS